LLSEEFNAEIIGTGSISEEKMTEAILLEAPEMYQQQKRLCYQLTVRWKRFISSKVNVEKDDIDHVAKIYKKNLESATFILSKLKELKEENIKFNYSKEAGLEWKTPIKLHQVLGWSTSFLQTLLFFL